MSTPEVKKEWVIYVRRKNGDLEAIDYAGSEEQARAQAKGWTGQRDQMTWVARIYGPPGSGFEATYKRGREAP